MDFRHRGEVDQIRTVNALELRGVELAFQLNNGIVHHIVVAGGGGVGQLAFGEEVRDLVEVDELHAVAQSGGDAARVVAPRLREGRGEPVDDDTVIDGGVCGT